MEGPFVHEVFGLTYCYSFNPQNGRGVLHSGGRHRSKIYVLYDVVDDSQYAVEGVSHPHLLNCIFVNRRERHVVFEAPQMKLQQMKDDWINGAHLSQKKAPLCWYYIRGKPGKWSRFLDPSYRVLIRQLYKLVIDLHGLNFSLKSLTMEHLWIDDDRSLKVCGAGLIVSRPPDTLRNDFELVISVMKEIIAPALSQGGAEISSYPPTIEDLMKETRALDCRATEDGKLVDDGMFLQDHLAITPPYKTLAFIEALGERLTTHLVGDRLPIGDILDEMSNCYKWESKFAGCEDIEKYYKHNREKNTKLETLDASRRKQSLLRFIRKIALHMEDLDDIHLETTILGLFAKEILSAQASLKKWGVLSTFMK